MGLEKRLMNLAFYSFHHYKKFSIFKGFCQFGGKEENGSICYGILKYFYHFLQVKEWKSDRLKSRFI